MEKVIWYISALCTSSIEPICTPTHTALIAGLCVHLLAALLSSCPYADLAGLSVHMLRGYQNLCITIADPSAFLDQACAEARDPTICCACGEA